MNKERAAIDAALKTAVTGSELALLQRWKTEYKQRVREELCNQGNQLPTQHSAYPGFEVGLVVRLCQLLTQYAPHCEWPYASHVQGSLERTDIHLVYMDEGAAREAWLEVGMYASDEEAKYSSDFEKLCVLLGYAPSALGVLIHFEVFERGKVFPLFQRFADEKSSQYDVDIQEIGDSANIHICRLFIELKGGYQLGKDLEQRKKGKAEGLALDR